MKCKKHKHELSMATNLDELAEDLKRWKGCEIDTDSIKPVGEHERRSIDEVMS